MAPHAPVLTRLAEFAVGYRERASQPVVRHAAVRAVVDWTANTVYGGREAPARILRQAVTESDGTAYVIPDGGRVSPRTAALVNGTASHTAELDDIYRDGLYHPGSPTIAAALAVAEHVGASGAALLRAVAVGYEVGCRVAEAVNPAHYRYWHTTGTVGALGAAAAAADLLDLSPAQVAHALATATTMGAGLQQAFRSDAMSKPVHAGHAADTGVLAAMAAARGLTGALDAFDGPAGFAAAMADSADIAKAVENPDAPACVTRMTVKKHACCGHTFAAVDAALVLRDRGLRAADVARIEVHTYRTAIDVAGNRDPKSAFEAKFSIGYCVAAALVRGAVRLEAFDANALRDPEIRRLLALTDVRADEDFDRAFPRQRGALVRLFDRSGAAIAHRQPTRRGDPDAPLTDDEVRAKFDYLVRPVLGERRTGALAAALWRLPESTGVGELMATMKGGGGPCAEPG